MEKWKKIIGFSSYEISDMGRIKTYNWKNKGREAIMKPALDASGYLRTMLKSDEKGGRFETVKVHRLVLMTFIGMPKPGYQCNHKNGIRSDNRLCNLEWVTQSENIKHSFRIGNSSNVGEKNPAATITEDMVIEIRKNYQFGKKARSGITKKELAEKYGVSFTVIKNIVMHRTWKHLS